MVVSLLENTLNNKFDAVHKYLGELKHELKIQDQKRKTGEADLRLGLFGIKHDLKESFTAEFKVAVEALESRFDKLDDRLTATEGNLHERIKNVGDLITNSFQKKIDTHEKRLKKLERTQHLAA